MEVPTTWRIITGSGGQVGTKKSYAVLYLMERCWKNWNQLINNIFLHWIISGKSTRDWQYFTGFPWGEQVGYSFDMIDFQKKFSFQSKPAQAALQVLQQEGFITLNDPVFNRLHFFIASKEQLVQFETENPMWEPLIKILLRTYAGIF